MPPGMAGHHHSDIITFLGQPDKQRHDFSAANGSTRCRRFVGDHDRVVHAPAHGRRDAGVRRPTGSPGSLSRCRAMPSSLCQSVHSVIRRQAQDAAGQGHVSRTVRYGQQPAGLHHVADMGLRSSPSWFVCRFFHRWATSMASSSRSGRKRNAAMSVGWAMNAEHVEQGRFAAPGPR